MYKVACTFHLDVYIKRMTTNSLFKYFDFIKHHRSTELSDKPNS